MISYVNFLGWLMAQDWLHIFLLNSHEKKAKITKNNCLLSLVSLLIHKSKQKHNKNILAPNLLSSHFFIFSQFFPPTYQSTFLPTHLPKKCSARQAQMRAKNS